MWLSKHLRTQLRPAAPAVTGGVVTITDPQLALAASDAAEEKRGALICAPAGISSTPAVGSESVAASVAGDTVLLGCVGSAESNLITLTVGSSSITLSRSGITLKSGSTTVTITPDGISGIGEEG